MAANPQIRSQLAALPDQPGVYVYRDAADAVLYVGKAKSLRRRVLSYFRAPLTENDPNSLRPRPDAHARTGEMVGHIDRLEVMVTSTESEALILEANLIKRYRPPFNIRLRDDKSYPYIAISMDEEYPRVYFTRERHRRKRIYFGPFSNAAKTRETLNALARIFPSRPCEGTEPGRSSGVPCLDYHIKRCMAPCIGAISKRDYAHLIDQIVAFLSGRYRGLERELEAEMRLAAAEQRFEQAAIHRNRLEAVRHLMERQVAKGDSLGTMDVIGVAIEGDAANVQVLQVRDGVMQDRQSFHMELSGDDDVAAVINAFAIEYYSLAMVIPPLVLVPQGADMEALTELLTTRRGRRADARYAERGDRRRLLDLADRNARFAVDQDRRRHEAAVARRRDALTQLQESLHLPAPPVRIECYDISNLGATHTVASMVVFEHGQPLKAHYRTFSTRIPGGPDDFARIEEAITRRFTRFRSGDTDPSFSRRPGLVLIDGGKGQLAAAIRGLEAAGATDIPIASLAKRYEEVYLPGQSHPVPMDEHSAAMRVLKAARDEAHRFALKNHRGKRSRAANGSVLDTLPGIGPARRAALLKHFGSPERFLQASPDEIAAVPGIPRKVAQNVYDRLHKTTSPDGIGILSEEEIPST